MRILLYTGKGGAGKTTIAAATAVRCAEAGRKTLLMGGDASQSLADCLNLPLSDEPAEVADNLWAQELDALERLERFWPLVEPVMAGGLLRSMTPIAPEELSLGPGMGDVLRLLALKEQCDSGNYDVIVVDLGSSLTALQTLSFPETAGWWIDRIVGQNGVQASELGQQLDALASALADVRRLLTDATQTSVRVVTTAEQLSLRDTTRALTFISLYGCNVDAVVLNRQKYVPRPIADAFAAWPLMCLTLYDRDIVGLKLLGEMARDMFPPEDDPAAVFVQGPVQRLSKTGDGYILSLRLPFVEESDIDLLQHSGQLILQVGRIRRVIQLPSPVDTLGAADAVLDEGILEIHFR